VRIGFYINWFVLCQMSGVGFAGLVDSAATVLIG
jgi:hypothetical protein